MRKLYVLCLVTAMAFMAAGVQAGPLADATADTLWGIEIGGFIDVSYQYNFNDPDGRLGGNNLRFNDVDHNDLNLHGLQLYMDRLPEEVEDVGFRFDVMIGEDADNIGDNITGDPDDFNLYQAYISYIAPIGNGLTIDVGRFVTWHGYEVIESPANDNFSRSWLFTYAVPYTHTGLRLTYPINDQWEISGGITQGWNVVDDNNEAKTGHLAVRWMPMETLYIQNSIAYGSELDEDTIDPSEGEQTFLYDLVASWNVREDITLGANFDYINQEIPNQSDADLWGLAGYIRYDVNEQLYLAFRGEYVDAEIIGGVAVVVDPVTGNIILDPAGNPVLTGGVGEDVDLWEVTFTLGYQVTDGLETRLEFRHDDADEDIFADNNGFDDTQDTIALEIIYAF